MNNDLKRVRESYEDGLNPSKRRTLSNASSPVASGSGSGGRGLEEKEDDGLEDWMRVVEMKRKEAIYRQMREYRREHDIDARRVRELEEQTVRLEAALRAVEVCWNTIVIALRDHIGTSESESSSAAALDPSLEPQSSRAAIELALQSRLPPTLQMVDKFFVLASKGSAHPISADELQRKLQALRSETSALQLSNQALQSQITSLTSSRDQFRGDLSRANKRIDKQRMEFDLAEKEWRTNVKDREREGTGTPGPKSLANGPQSGHATPNGKLEVDNKPDLDKADAMLQDTTELEQISALRLKELDRVRADHSRLSIEVDRLRLAAHQPSEDALRSAPFFQIYQHQLSQYYNRAQSFQQRFEAAESKLDELRHANLNFRDAVLAEGKAEAEQLRAQVNKQNSDLSRLRGQRDDLTAELTERKLREEHRLKWFEEMEGLEKSRVERVNGLVGEVRRLKGYLGARDGAGAYLEFLGKEGVERDYLKTLEHRLAEAQEQVRVLSAQNGDLEDVRNQLGKSQAALAKFESIFGSAADVVNDPTALGSRLELAEREKSALRMQLKEAETSTNALYTEVENLAKLTESLQSQLHSKLFEVRDVDARMGRLATEKAKADNKYFQAMRSKEAIEAECKAAQRSVEKQLKLLERAQEVERGLQAQIAAHETGFTAVKNESLAIQTQLATLSAEKTQLELRLQAATSSLSEAQSLLQQRVTEAANDRELRLRAQEAEERSQTAIKKLKERQEHLLASSGGNVSASEVQMKEERDKLLKLLRCSCCEQNFKQQVIVKCMHTFCKQCLELRIASRQRKCPACGLSFAKEDVQTLYWQ